MEAKVWDDVEGVPHFLGIHLQLPRLAVFALVGDAVFDVAVVDDFLFFGVPIYGLSTFVGDVAEVAEHRCFRR